MRLRASEPLRPSGRSERSSVVQSLDRSFAVDELQERFGGTLGVLGRDLRVVENDQDVEVARIGELRATETSHRHQGYALGPNREAAGGTPRTQAAVEPASVAGVARTFVAASGPTRSFESIVGAAAPFGPPTGLPGPPEPPTALPEPGLP